MNDYQVSFIHDDFLLMCYVFAENHKQALGLGRDFMIHDKGVPDWLVNSVEVKVEQK